MSHFQLPEKPFAAVIFDCDGTLADSMPMHFAGWRQAYIEGGANFELTWDEFYSLAGSSPDESISAMNERYGCNMDPLSVTSAYLRIIEKMHDQVQPIAEIVTFARECKAAGKPVAVASGGTREHVHKTLKLIGLEDFFPVVITHEDVTYSKPAPDIFLLAAKRLGVKPAECLVFEDSVYGLEAADKAGMQSVYIDALHFSAGPTI